MRAPAPPRVRPEQCVLIPCAGRVEPILPDGEKEIAELLEIAQEDLTSLDYGVGGKSRVWMSRSLQRDREAPVNRAVSHGLMLNGLDLAIRGNAIVHHREHDFDGQR